MENNTDNTDSTTEVTEGATDVANTPKVYRTAKGQFPKGKSGNVSGRPKGKIEAKGKTTKRELKERELLMLLRKMRPLVADAVGVAAKIIKDEMAKQDIQLRAATIVIDNYRRLSLDLYDGEDTDAEAQEVQQNNAPVFSLRMIDSGEVKVA